MNVFLPKRMNVLCSAGYAFLMYVSISCMILLFIDKIVYGSNECVNTFGTYICYSSTCGRV